MIKPVLLILALLLSYRSMAIDIGAELQDCAQKNNDAVRLVCYDSLANDSGKANGIISKGITSKEIASNGKVSDDKVSDDKIGQWHIESSNSLFDSSINHSFSLQVDHPVTSKNQTVTPYLILQCSNGESRVEIRWNIYLGKNSTSMHSRFDSGTIEEKKWSILDSKRAVQYRGNPKSFIAAIMGHQKLSVKIRPHNGSPIAATFSIGGLSAKMAPLAIDCDW